MSGRQPSFCIHYSVFIKHPIFEYLPIENMVHDKQQDYYNAIGASTHAGQSGPFIDFMLNEILHTLQQHQGAELADVGRKEKGNVGANERKILTIIANTPKATAREMADAIGTKNGRRNRH